MEISGLDQNVPQEIDADQYRIFLNDLVNRIQRAQLAAAASVNRELTQLYWSLGRLILQKQREYKWGDKLIDLISKDLRSRFSDVKGFSITNLRYMRQFASAYQEIVPPIDTVPWRLNLLVVQKIQDPQERLWYLNKTIEQGWSYNVLKLNLKTDLFSREGKSSSNFHLTLPSPQSDLAQQTLKDPYCFDFLALREGYEERELEEGLVAHVRKTLLEFGVGFAFIAQQHHLEVSGKDYYLDLLFYNYKLKCFCVVELKTGNFEPSVAGQMSFYLSAVDDLLRQPDDNPTIGIVLCQEKDEITVEYTLRGVNKPIGVSGYQVDLIKTLPQELERGLPSSEEIATRLEKSLRSCREGSKEQI